MIFYVNIQDGGKFAIEEDTHMVVLEFLEAMKVNKLHRMFKFLNERDIASRSWGLWRPGRGLNPRHTRAASQDDWWPRPREWWPRQRSLDTNKMTS